MALTRQEAIEIVRIAVRAKGVGRVAESAGVPQTHLSTVMSGARGLGKETAAKIRPLLPEVDAETWLAAMGVEMPEPPVDAPPLQEPGP
jgi:plasmid maintenance system antidote protein VapI